MLQLTYSYVTQGYFSKLRLETVLFLLFFFLLLFFSYFLPQILFFAKTPALGSFRFWLGKSSKTAHSKGGDDAGVDYFRHYCLFTSPQDIFSLSAYWREKSTLLFPLLCSRPCVDFSSFAVVAYLLTLRVAVRNGRKCRRWVSFYLLKVTIYYNCKHVRKIQPFSQITWCLVCTKKRSSHRLQAIKHRMTFVQCNRSMWALWA